LEYRPAITEGSTTLGSAFSPTMNRLIKATSAVNLAMNRSRVRSGSPASTR